MKQGKILLNRLLTAKDVFMAALYELIHKCKQEQGLGGSILTETLILLFLCLLVLRPRWYCSDEVKASGQKLFWQHLSPFETVKNKGSRRAARIYELGSSDLTDSGISRFSVLPIARYKRGRGYLQFHIDGSKHFISPEKSIEIIKHSWSRYYYGF